MVYWKKSENDLAKLYFSLACQIKPFCVNTWINYGDLLFQTNDLISAEHVYKRILALEPKLFNVRNKYGKLLFCTNKIKDAKRQFKIALNSAPECQEALNNLADLYFIK